MARYNIAFRTTDGTTATPAAEIRATSSDRSLILELELHCVSAAAAIVGIGTPALIGVNPTTTYRVQLEDPTFPAGATIVATSWATAPTVPANFYRRLGLKAAAGAAMIVAFPRGLVVPQSGSIVLWNVQTNPFLDVSLTVDE